MMSDEEKSTSNEVDDTPPHLYKLPPDFVMETVLELTEEQQCHRVTFYQAALTACAQTDIKS